MRIGVPYSGRSAQFELDPERLLGCWMGPEDLDYGSIAERVRSALESPSGYPPLRQIVVPGDRVVIPFDPSTPDLDALMSVLCTILLEAGVEFTNITLLAVGPPGLTPPSLPPGVRFERHDPDDASKIAYLASTSGGRRVYLDRLATDADVVIPVGTFGHLGEASFRGPWTSIFPGLSDLRTQEDVLRRDRVGLEHPGTHFAEKGRDDRAVSDMAEAAEVSWLLGSQFHVGVLAGRSGALDVLAGQQDEVRRRGVANIDVSWTVRSSADAALVVAGIGVAWKPTTFEDLVEGLDAGGRLARPGGKVVALTDLDAWEPGRAVRRLAEVDDPRMGPSALKGLEREADYPVASRLARILVHSDVYLLSRIDADLVESLGMIPLDRVEDAQRLARLADTVLILSPAEWMRVASSAIEEDPGD